MAYKVKTAALHVTKACSHRCPFCYASSQANAAPPDHDTILKVIEALSVGEVEEVVFLGGDPCAYPRILDLAVTAKNYGLATTVLSNTHRYHGARTEDVTWAVDCFETTIHGPSAEDHDAVALRTGAFRDVLKALGTIWPGARSVGIIYNITPYNSRKLNRTVRTVIDDFGITVDHLVLQRIVPQGRARTTSKFAIGCSHAVAALEELDRVLSRYRLTVFFEDPFPWCVVPERYHKYLARCEWGFTRVAVDGTGNLSRCGADPRYRLGNILQRPLLEIWNSSPALDAFRSREYLPLECRQCRFIDRCGGGCALSCEIEADHGADYLYYERFRRSTPNPLQASPTQHAVRMARREDLSDILRIEWGCFPDFDFRFSPDGLLRWHAHNPDMFCVLEDSDGRVSGYACIVPLTNPGYQKVISGAACSLQELAREDVCSVSDRNDGLFHIEAIATTTSVNSRAGRTLIRRVGEFLLSNANKITASPITYIGTKLCSYFRFRRVATDRGGGKAYDVYLLDEPLTSLKLRLERF